MNKIITTFSLLFLFTISVSAQYFSRPVEAFSKKKTTIINLKNGEEIKGNFKKMSRKKFLITEIKMELEDGSKKTYLADEIASMYLPQSGIDKLGKAMEFSEDVRLWTSEDINQEYVKDGYAYFEQSEVQLKKKKVQALLQLLNPAFNNHVKIYHNPWAGETAGVGIGGFTVAGGDDKSYYVKYGNEIAYKMARKDYDDEKEKLFGGCEAAESAVKENAAWKHFPQNLYLRSTECK